MHVCEREVWIKREQGATIWGTFLVVYDTRGDTEMQVYLTLCQAKELLIAKIKAKGMFS